MSLVTALDACIAEFELRVAALTDCIVTLRKIREEEKPSTMTPAPAVVAESAPARFPLKARGGGNNKLPFFDALMMWIGQHSGPFGLNDLPEAFQSDRFRVGRCLSNLASNGKLKRVGHGRYLGVGVAQDAPLAPAPKAAPASPTIAPKYHPAASGAPVLDDKLIKERAAKAARYIIGLHKGKSLGALTLIEECRSLFPQLVESDNRIQDFRVALIDAANAGLLTRIGKGPEAVYCDPIPS